MLNGMENESPGVDNTHEVVGSIWKQQPGSLKRKAAAVTARRPLLALMQTPQGDGGSKPTPLFTEEEPASASQAEEESAVANDESPMPLKKTPRSVSSSSSPPSPDPGSGEKKKMWFQLKSL
jgi:hypothetical protein